MIRRFLLRWLINILGLAAAAALISGIHYGGVRQLVIAALVFSIVNACIRPLVVVLALPAIVVTLGLFVLVVNGFMLYLTSKLYPAFQVASFGQAVLAVVIIWIINYALTQLTEGARESAV